MKSGLLPPEIDGDVVALCAEAESMGFGVLAGHRRCTPGFGHTVNPLVLLSAKEVVPAFR